MLKGGLVVELRVQRARATKDIDVRLVGPTSLFLGTQGMGGRRNPTVAPPEWSTMLQRPLERRQDLGPA